VKPLLPKDLEHILVQTSSLWESARGRRIFVSGGTGFLGAWVLESLAYCNRMLDLKISVTVLSRDPDKFARRMPHLAGESAIRLLKGDVRDFAFPEGEFHYVLHGAASSSAEAAEKPLDLLGTMVDGTRRMLLFAEAARAQRFLFVSSGAVYGRQPQDISNLPETYLGGPDWLDSKSAYAEGKRVAEQICAIWARQSGLHTTIARCFTFVGPHQPLDKHFAIGNFIADALERKTIRVRGDGTPLRSYLYGADLAIWLWTMLLWEDDSRNPLQIFNVGSGEAISIGQVAHVVREAIDPSLKVEVVQRPVPGDLRLTYVPDVREAERCFGLRQTIGLSDAIQRTAAWHRPVE
jgi:nucleoside-diphosphate-sugar epimerase